MKGTQVEGTIQRLFEGSIRSYIKCVDVSFTSSRVETYYDIQVSSIGRTSAEYSHTHKKRREDSCLVSADELEAFRCGQ